MSHHCGGKWAELQVFFDDEEKVRVVELVTANCKLPSKGSMKTKIENMTTTISLKRRAMHRICPLPVNGNVVENQNVPLAIGKNDKPTETMENVRKPMNVKHCKRTRIHKMKTNPLPKYEEEYEEPIATRTRARAKNFKNINLMLMILAFFAKIFGINGKQCMYEGFQNEPGLNFEDIRKLALTNDNWNIICVVNLDSYWKQAQNIKPKA